MRGAKRYATAVRKAAAKAACADGKLGSAAKAVMREFAGRTILKKLFIQLTDKATEPTERSRIAAEEGPFPHREMRK